MSPAPQPSTGNGQEYFTYFKTKTGHAVRYDYETEDGREFMTVAPSLLEARERREAWEKNHE